MWTITLVTLICFYSLVRFYRRSFSSSTINPEGKYVLISGCDTGFGRALAIRFDQKNFHVFAGVYNVENAAHLQAQLSTRATVFPLDITKLDDINLAYDRIIGKTKTLHALINNAGVSMGGNLDWTSMEVFRRMMDVNFFGHVAMTKKFLPLLIVRRNCRVVNVCSMCGFISVPGSAAYCASIYALESFSDCLRREMFPWDLQVSIIEPGAMRTPMAEQVEETIKNIWLQSPIEVRERWGETFFDHCLQRAVHSPFIRYAESPEKVVRAIEHAIMSSTPRIRYRPGWQSSLVFFPLSLLPDWLLDLMLSFAFPGSPAGLTHQN